MILDQVKLTIRLSTIVMKHISPHKSFEEIYYKEITNFNFVVKGWLLESSSPLRNWSWNFIFDCQSFPPRSSSCCLLPDRKNTNVEFCKKGIVGTGWMYFPYHRLTSEGPTGLFLLISDNPCAKKCVTHEWVQWRWNKQVRPWIKMQIWVVFLYIVVDSF